LFAQSGEDCDNVIKVIPHIELSGFIDYNTASANVDDYHGDSCSGVPADPANWGNSPDLVYRPQPFVPISATLQVWIEGADYDVVVYVRYGTCTGPQAGCITGEADTIVWSNTTFVNGAPVWFFVDGNNGVGSARLYYCMGPCPASLGQRDRVPFSAITITPIPSSGQVTFSMEMVARETLNLKILNPLGQIIHDEFFDDGPGLIRKYVDLDESPSGLYVLYVSSDSSVVARQIMLQEVAHSHLR